MISVAAVIVQQQWISVELGDDQIGSAVAVHIGGDQGARVHQLHLVEFHPCRHVLKTRRAQVPQRAQLRPVLRFDHGNQVEPAIVVDVDGGQSPPGDRILYRQGDALEALALYIAPQRDAWAACVGEGHIHPPILVEIEHHRSHCRRKTGVGKKRRRFEVAFARVGEECGRLAGSGYQQIDRTIVIEVR